tara:strand:- start:527 stop:739 length:213 start_codon:yes stop_codon:yes gene_type:complete
LNKDLKHLLKAKIQKVSTTMVEFNGNFMLLSQLKCISKQYDLKAFLVDKCNIVLRLSDSKERLDDAVVLF